MKSPTYLFLVIVFLLTTAADRPGTDPFASRRTAMIPKLEGGILILTGGGDSEENRNEARPDNYFWYLTGIDDPDVITVIDPKAMNKYMLFVPEQNVIAEIYGGKRPSKEEIKQRYGADTVVSYLYFSQWLRTVALDKRLVLTTKEIENISFYNKTKNQDEKLIVHSATPILDEMRLVKDEQEIAMLKNATDITGTSLREAWKACKPGMYEYEMEALIEYGFRKSGSPMPAYRSIVGSGPNSTILHYEKNERQMRAGELLLMDVGAEYGYYAADITRVIPVSGVFNKEQREIYELVLKSEEEAIKEMKPGKGILECHHRSVEVITDGLVKLGLMTDANSLWQKKVYVIYRVNHWLGLDVHDVGSYGPASPDFRTYMFDKNEKGRLFKPGMVSTIEPGLYFRNDLMENLRLYAGKDVPQAELDEFVSKVKPVYERYKDIGVRIEDDVLITQDGNEVLSASSPKTIEEIEAIMKK
jgi:Xaa-Pro aminopeptidase